MDVVKYDVAATGAERRRVEAEVEKLVIKPLGSYLIFLYVGSVVVLMAPTLTPEARPATVLRLPAGFDFPVTCATFVAATLLQKKLSRVLERRPATSPRLTPLAARMVAVLTWFLATESFVSYLRFGGNGYFVRSRYEWAAAGVAAAANLGMVTRTVMRLRRIGIAEQRKDEEFNVSWLECYLP